MRKRYFLITLILFSAPACAAEVHRWVDEQGNIHFTDDPPDGRQTELIDIDPDINLQSAPALTSPLDKTQRRGAAPSWVREQRLQKEREQQIKCADYEEQLRHLRSRMRAGYKASQYNRLMEREASLKRRLRAQCK